jgi:DNA mismatch endonuclease (patch repair protein)
MMSGIRSKNTQPEMIVRRALHARGFRYRLHAKDLPGKPDMVFPRYRCVLLIHGCFWHGHNCQYFKVPKTRTKFWLEKIRSNQTRDTLAVEQLLATGWSVIILWECSLKPSGPGILAVTDQLAERLPILASQAAPSVIVID